jgi:hypothetical protein
MAEYFKIVGDYSVLPVGTKIGNGEIKKCPYCEKKDIKRNGLYKVIQGGFIWVTHSVTLVLPSPDVGDIKKPTAIGADECPPDGTPMLKQSSDNTKAAE